jgi:cyanophycinase-like exopeptidase
MVRSRIRLIGGGPGALRQLRAHLATAVAEARAHAQLPGGRAPVVAYVGAASDDDAGFRAMIGQEIERGGGRVRSVSLAKPRAQASAAKAVLEACDLVFVSGGDVDHGMRVLRAKGMLPTFRALARAGRPMVGLSAGSIMLGRAWVRFPGEPEDAAGTKRPARSGRAAPKLFACLGLAPVYVDAHAEADGWDELRVLLALAAARGEERPVGFGLTPEGGIVVEPAVDGGPATVVPFGTPAPRFALRRGRAVEVAPLRLGARARV